MKKIALLLEQEFPDTASVCAPINELQAPLFEEEKPCVRNCVPKRVRGFVSGRTATRQAMKKLGFPPAAVPQGKQREPLWTEGLTGSISHTDEFCLCLLAKADFGLSIGVDLEEAGRVTNDLFHLLFTSHEIDRLNHLSPEKRGFQATALFSAKEAFFKFQFPVTKAFPGFEDVEVEVCEHKISLKMVCPEKFPLIQQEYNGLLVFEKNLLATAFCTIIPR